MFKLKLEDSGRKLFGLWVVFLAVIYILASFGRIEWLQWVAVGSGILLSLFVFGQAGTLDYFRQKKYKNIGTGDFVVWISSFFAGVVFLNSLFLIQMIRNLAPAGLLNFTTAIGVTSGVIVSILALIFAFSSKPKA